LVAGNGNGKARRQQVNEVRPSIKHLVALEWRPLD